MYSIYTAFLGRIFPPSALIPTGYLAPGQLFLEQVDEEITVYNFYHPHTDDIASLLARRSGETEQVAKRCAVGWNATTATLGYHLAAAGGQKQDPDGCAGERCQK